jgi:hypothetical protein
LILASATRSWQEFAANFAKNHCRFGASHRQIFHKYSLFPGKSPVLPGPNKHSRPYLAKTTAIFKAFTATSQKISHCMIFQSTTTIKTKKT